MVEEAKRKAAEQAKLLAERRARRAAQAKARKDAIEAELEARKKTMALVALGAIALCVSVGTVGLAGTLVLAALLACLVEYDFVAGCVRTAADYAAPLGAAAVRMIAAVMAS